MKEIWGRFGALPPFNEKGGYLNFIAETPKGSRNKYSYDPEPDYFVFKK